MRPKIISWLVLAALVGAGIYLVMQKAAPQPSAPPPDQKPQEAGQATQTVELAAYSPIYRFSARIPNGWSVEYVPGSEAINIFDPTSAAPDPLDRSRIFIRHFRSGEFLTLNTVTIHTRTPKTLGGHEAIEYDIEKKSGLPDFAAQPDWRNQRHRVLDVRLTGSSPTTFYVITRPPDLPEEIFDQFTSSLRFHTDEGAFVAPLQRARERITKKPFGIYVTPATSPVQPERFSGYHTGTDFEAFSDELTADVAFSAICGGPIVEKRNVEGYGGVVVQSCDINTQTLRVVYGHVKLASVTSAVAAYLVPGQPLGNLGDHESPETDGERKHLHLGIHKGEVIQLSGYVDSPSELSRWLNPQDLFR